MRIALLIAAFHPRVGGAERQAMLLARTLQQRHGAELTVVTRGAPGAPARETLDGIRIVRAPAAERNRWIASAAYMATSVPFLTLRREPFAVYQCVQSYSPATIGAIAARIRRGRLIVKVTASNQLGEAAELRRLPFFRLRMKLLDRVDTFVAITGQIERELVALGIGPERIVKIPNGVAIGAPPTRERQRMRKQELGVDETTPVAVYTGRLSEEKGLDVLIDAWAHVVVAHPQARLFIVGAGGQVRNVEAALRATVAQRALAASVRFVGSVTDVTPYLEAADLFVLPSRSEGFSNALLEAMAAGKAIVTTDIDANASLTHDTHCLKVPAGDAPALHRALATLLDDAALRARLGSAALQLARDRFSIETIADRYMALYRGQLS
jgi:glycosyltransferase involved in cell wall biosynthesis